MPTFSGIDHVALTVTDLAVSVPFYMRVLGMAPATTMTDGPFTRRMFALPGGQGLGLTQHARPPTAELSAIQPRPGQAVATSPAP